MQEYDKRAIYLTPSGTAYAVLCFRNQEPTTLKERGIIPDCLRLLTLRYSYCKIRKIMVMNWFPDNIREKAP